MKTRVIEFIRDLSDGGAETLVKDYVKLIDKNKFDLYVLTIRNFTNTAVYKQVHELGIEIIPIYPKWNFLIKLFNKLFGKQYIDYKMRKIITQIRPSCIHAHLYTLDYLFRISSSLHDVKLYYTCHSIPERYFGEKYEKQTRAAEYLIQKKGMRMIALHDNMRDELNQMFGVNNTITIKNGIDLNRYRNDLDKKEEIRESLGIPNDAFVVGNVGRFIEIKNHTFLIDVFRKIKDLNDHAYLLLVGDGELKESILNKVRLLNLDDSVIILSHRADVPRLMRAMDVFIFPSKIEGFGIAAIEAQAAGLRCLISDTVPTSTHISELAIPLSLELSPVEWATIALNRDIFSEYSDRIEDYDMNKEIKKLEKLYLD